MRKPKGSDASTKEIRLVIVTSTASIYGGTHPGTEAQAGCEEPTWAVAQWLTNNLAETYDTEPREGRSTLESINRLAEDVSRVVAVPGMLWVDSPSLEPLEALAGQFTDTRFLLLYSQPVPILAAALAQGLASSRVSEDWISANRELLRFQRHYLRRSVMIEATAVARNHEAFLDLLKRHGVQPHTRSEPFPAEASQDHGNLAFERIIAGHFLQQKPDASALVEELEASSIPLGRGHSDNIEPDWSELYHAYAEFRGRFTEQTRQLEAATWAKEEAERKADDATKENTLLIQQLHEVQEELESVLLQRLEMEERETEVAGERNRLRQRVEELEYCCLSSKELVRNVESSEEENPILPENEAPDTPKSFISRLIAPRSVGKKKPKGERAQARLLRKSKFFDSTWYRQEYPDVAEAGMDPVIHYLRIGAFEGRNPSPDFENDFYLESNPDVAESGMNPLVHYLRFGYAEGRLPSNR